MIPQTDLSMLEPFIGDIVATYGRWQAGGQLAQGCMIVQLGDPSGSGFNATHRQAAADWFTKAGDADIAADILAETPPEQVRLVLRVRIAVPQPGFSTYATSILAVDLDSFPAAPFTSGRAQGAN